MIKKIQNPVNFLLILMMIGTSGTSCRKKKDHRVNENLPQYHQQAGVVSEALKSNQIGELPGDLFFNQKKSAIHWQPWSKETFAKAKVAKRLIFCVVVMPKDPEYMQVLEQMEKDPVILQSMNQDYIPVLVDASSVREMGMLTSELSMEIKKPISFPFFMWLTCEGNPVGWTPVVSRNGLNGKVMYDYSHNLIFDQWMGDPQYILQNSVIDNQNRQERLKQFSKDRELVLDADEAILKSLRQLTSLYDPVTRTFDEVGALVPAGVMQLLANVSTNRTLPEALRKRSSEINKELMEDLLSSPIFDPIDGGVFLGRRSKSWSLPSYARDCAGQVRVAEALFDCYRATQNARALYLAKRILLHVESQYMAPDQLFKEADMCDSDPKKWMWTEQDIRQVLSKEDADLWIKITKMTELGNLPSEADPKRQLYRYNTVAIDRTVHELAQAEGTTYEQFFPRYSQILNQLYQARQKRFQKPAQYQHGQLEASLRMVSAYAYAYSVTGEKDYQKKSEELLKRIESQYWVGETLWNYPERASESTDSARAHGYGLAIQAALDVAAITGQSEWRVVAAKWMKAAQEKFMKDGVLEECSGDAKIMDLPIVDRVMLFEDSTVGVMASNVVRMEWLGLPVDKALGEFVTGFPNTVEKRPIMYTDLISGYLGRSRPQVLLCGKGLSEELTSAVKRLSPRAVIWREAKDEEGVPDGVIRLKEYQGVEEITTLEQLKRVFPYLK